MITLHLPAMSSRADARTVSIAISDVPGVRTLRADVVTRTVRVTGPVDPTAVTDAVTAVGYAVERTTTDAHPGGSAGENPDPPQRSSVPTPHHHSSPRSTPMSSVTSRTFVGPTTFVVTGMTCSHCERAVTAEISAVAGIESVDVDLAAGTVTVTAARPVDRAEIAAAVDEAGYVLAP